MLHMHANQGFIRDFADGKTYLDEYILNIYFIELSPEVIFLQGAFGKISKESALELYELLRSKGVKRIHAFMPTKWVAKGFKPLKDTDLHYLEI